MRIVTNNELSNYKVLPFDLYTEEKGKILEAGEILTPGKLIMLKNYSKIYTEDNKNFLDQNGNANPEEQTEIERMTNFTYESLDPQDFSTVVNKDASMPSETQIKIKFFYRKVLDLLLKGYYQESIIKLLSMVNVLKNVIYKQMNKTSKGSHTRFMGEYELCHPLNVAVVSGLIAKKLDYY